ncbi:MAG TPA: PAS domain S-box protein [Candidatus Limnocylindrales bacterium]|nr:PAS domain S-box protein [Candidatus Limnocylindrales bacterium]
MTKPLHILHLEDDPDFAELVRTLLQEDALEAELKRVAGRAEFEAALDNDQFDVILSDFRLPKFTGLEALAYVRKGHPDLPFILISGTIGEHAAIESLKAGATDYVLKHNPERLASAVRRAALEAGERAKRRRVETELVRREKYFRTLTENTLDILCILSREGNFLYASPSMERVLGYAPAELEGTDSFAHVHPEDLPPVREMFQKAVQQPDGALKIQFRYQQKDGMWKRLELVGQNRLADPDAAGIVTNWRDVTDRWRAEEELRRSEKQYRLLFQDNPNPMWVFDLETLAFLEVNKSAIQHYGYSPEEFLAMKMSDLRRIEKEEPSQKAALGDAGSGHIWRHRRKDGSFIDVEVVWSPMAFRNRFAALAMVTDVTERCRNEHRNEVFSKLSHRLSSATTAAEAATIICEASDVLFAWDDFALDLYSAEKDEVFSLLNIATVDEHRVKIPESSQSKSANTLIRRVITKGAELVHTPGPQGHAADAMLVPVRKGTRLIGVLFVQSRVAGAYTGHDLETLQTLADQCGGALERVNAEEALRESQRRFRDLFENSPDAIFVVDLNGRVLDVNLASCLLHGLTPERLVGKNLLTDLVPETLREQARQDFDKMASGKWTQAESESLTAEGRITPVEVRASRIEYGGRPAVLLHVRDITERREAEAALQSSETLFRSVWQNSVTGLRLANEQGIMVAVNDAFCRLVGMEAQALAGQPLTVIYAAAEDRDNILEQHREAFLARSVTRKPERRYVLHNGNAVTLEILDSFIQLHERPLLMLSLFRDVTTQRQLEEQLRQSQKMEAIGQLAGGVAHDFNNILTVIQGHASLLAAANLGESAGKSADQIIQAAERAARLTRQLLTFSRRQLIQPKKLDVNRIVGNMTNMLGRLLGEDVALQLNYCQTPPMVDADVGMLEQVLLNLAVNARDAMPKGGQLALRIAIVDLGESYGRGQSEAHAGRFVCLSVTDTGTGIAPENLRRIFEPFFTTKEIGKGTGLGLATAYGIVKQHQGWIEVDSQVGMGTTFRIYLPYAGTGQHTVEKPTAQITVRGGNETILLVEDEAPVCELVSRLLGRYGYKVLSANDAAEAIEVWQNNKDEIALLLTDLVMPNHMNGRELAETLWAEQPELKVIFTSGYSADIVGKDFKLEPELNFLQKPYHPQMLAMAVRRCLDGKRN